MSDCNDENTAKHAPLQRNNEAAVFCNIMERGSDASRLLFIFLEYVCNYACKR
jgi:hypothetical protein